MSLTKPECPQCNTSEHVRKYKNRWYCSSCGYIFRTTGTGGAERSDFSVFLHGRCVAEDRPIYIVTKKQKAKLPTTRKKSCKRRKNKNSRYGNR